MDNKALIILTNKHDEIGKESNTYNRLITELDYFKYFIPKFFSVNGEAEGIRNLYKAVEDEKNANKVIICSDVYKLANIYKEYLDGMVAFIDDVNNLTIDDGIEGKQNVIDNLQNKLNKAKENDLQFIQSLVDGKFSEKEEVTLKDGMLNIEYLIELLPYMEDMNCKCTKIDTEMYHKGDDIKTELLRECCKLLHESVRRYCYTLIKYIITTYFEIKDAINTNPGTNIPTPAQKFVLY